MKKYYSLILVAVTFLIVGGICAVTCSFLAQDIPVASNVAHQEKVSSAVEVSGNKATVDDGYLDDFELEEIDKIFAEHANKFYNLMGEIRADKNNLKESEDIDLNIVIDEAKTVSREADIISERIVERINDIFAKGNNAEKLVDLEKEYSENIQLAKDNLEEIVLLQKDKEGSEKDLVILFENMEENFIDAQKNLAEIAEELRKF